MGLDCGLHSGKCTPDSLSEAKAMLPKVFEPILEGNISLCITESISLFQRWQHLQLHHNHQIWSMT